MSRPRKNTRPPLGRSMPDTRLKNVVFPAPFGPMMALTRPPARLMLRLSTAVRPPNRLVRPSVRSTASLMGRPAASVAAAPKQPRARQAGSSSRSKDRRSLSVQKSPLKSPAGRRSASDAPSGSIRFRGGGGGGGEIVSSHWEHHSLIVGLLAILVVIFAPKGIVGLWNSWIARLG